MANEVQLSEPASELYAVAERVTQPWLRRSIERVARAGGCDPSGWADLDEVVEGTAAALLDALRELLATDVDEQRNNPLSLYRAAAADPCTYLRDHGVPEPAHDRFLTDHFPDDPYGIGPATWADIDAELKTPGLTWGAWKAMTVLQRRRDEGRR